jgi:quercetin dioxygenase-like cupin family protein
MGAFEIKAIRDAIADTATAPDGIARRNLWKPSKGRKREKKPQAEKPELPLEVDVYTIEPGKEDGAHCHPGVSELLISWSGFGTVYMPGKPGGDVMEIPLNEGETLVVPKGAVHRCVAGPKGFKPDPLGEATEKWVLVAVHARHAPRKAVALTGRPAPPLGEPELKKYRRKIKDPDYLRFVRDPEKRAGRKRIWGIDAQEDDGAADNAKDQLHLTLYTFVPGQENPEHFHPHSTELVVCLQGEATTRITFPMVGGSYKDGWHKAETRVLRAGDTTRVPMAALHVYTNKGTEDLLLLALQTPQPIMHILKDQIDV